MRAASRVGSVWLREEGRVKRGGEGRTCWCAAEAGSLNHRVGTRAQVQRVEAGVRSVARREEGGERKGGVWATRDAGGQTDVTRGAWC